MLTKQPIKQSTWGTKCPDCKSHVRTRIHRKFWMRLVPWSKHYLCAQCRCEYLSIVGILSLQNRCGDNCDDSFQL